ncbi:MAG TPA: hypothetical protein VK145_00040 [Candidatus Nanoarchaeia archaeon]|nr:hypothetical protein [Candidatus Nanoarchaeia archaeon]
MDRVHTNQPSVQVCLQFLIAETTHGKANLGYIRLDWYHSTIRVLLVEALLEAQPELVPLLCDQVACLSKIIAKVNNLVVAHGDSDDYFAWMLENLQLDIRKKLGTEMINHAGSCQFVPVRAGSC